MKDTTAEAFQNVGDMEMPLATIRDLAMALAFISEKFSDNEGSVVQRLAWLVIENCDELEKARRNLFRLSHPNRDHFEKEGLAA